MINKRGITSVSFVLMLIISTFAFAYMIGSEVKIVNAAAIPDTYLKDVSVSYRLSSNNDIAVLSNGNLIDLKSGDLYRDLAGYNVGSSLGMVNPTTIDTLNTKGTTSITQPADTTSSPTEQDYNSMDDNEILGRAEAGDQYARDIAEDRGLNLNEDLNTPIITNNPTPAPAISQTSVTLTEISADTSKQELIGLAEQGDWNAQQELIARADENPTEYKKIAELYQQEKPATLPAKTQEGRGTMENPFGKGQVDWGAGQLLEGVKWAGIAAGLTLTIGGLFIKDKAELNAITAGITAGILVGKSVYALLGKGGYGELVGGPGDVSKYFGLQESWISSPWTSGAIGAATAWMVYNAMWSSEKVSVETVTFNCLPWQAPNGGTDCELCNDENLPCSEYRCRSLGQSCEIVNKGTKEERCVNVNPRDSSPPVITPNNADLSSGFQYFDIKDMPPSPGFSIKSTSTSTGCLPAYTPIQFGISTNEPSQCKIDIAPKGNYSQMVTYMNGDNMYKYNHSEFLNLPSSADIKNSSIKLQNGKELIFYIRCKDAAGNTNEADYALKICVDPSPDNTAPVVQGTSIKNKGCVPSDAENATVDFYINEPSECRWDYFDKDYDQMGNNMLCSTSAVEINAIQSYTCVTQLKGIARDGNNFFVRCKDQPEGIVNESKRNKMQESYIFNLRRSNQLKLSNIKPNETIFGAIRPTPVELYAETLFGCEDNKAICYYSTTNSPNSFVQFFDNSETTNEGIHTQRLDLNDGTYTYYVRCVDDGGNVANSTTQFKVSIDTNAPVVARAYEEDGYLKLVTPLNSECVYNTESCDYLFNEGTQMPYANSTAHVTEWFADKKYFIKCRDQYRSEPVDCSLIVRPTENFLGD
jgi:hypothetical protein